MRKSGARVALQIHLSSFFVIANDEHYVSIVQICLLGEFPSVCVCLPTEIYQRSQLLFARRETLCTCSLIIIMFRVLGLANNPNCRRNRAAVRDDAYGCVEAARLRVRPGCFSVIQ